MALVKVLEPPWSLSVMPRGCITTSGQPTQDSTRPISKIAQGYEYLCTFGVSHGIERLVTQAVALTRTGCIGMALLGQVGDPNQARSFRVICFHSYQLK